MLQEHGASPHSEWRERPDVLQSPEMARPAISTKNTEKKTPPARNSELPEFTPKIPRKYRKNAPKIPKMRIFGIFSVFLGYFLGVPEFRPEGYFSWKFRVGPSRGSVAGRGVLNTQKGA